jgi:Flp pilus assembly protein TadG
MFLIIFAVAEFGLAFKDWLTVSHAAREGARAGATYGDDAAADFLILQDVGRHLGPAAVQVQQVRIYNADNPLSGTNYDYTPGNFTDFPQK